MEKAEKDKLSIKRNGLLALKCLFDTIDKIRQLYYDEENVLKTNLHKLVEGTKINDWNDLNALLKKAEGLGAANFTIHNDSGISGWGNKSVGIFLQYNFDEISERTRKEYHEINELLLQEEKELSDTRKPTQPEVKIIQENSLWKLTHPVYWAYKTYLVCKKYPKISLVIFILIIGIILMKFYGWKIDSLDLSGPKIVPSNK